MGKEIKYYTPSIEDIYIGYECEIAYDEHTFKKDIIDPHVGGYDDSLSILKYYLDKKHLRTKYLDLDDIIKEGFVLYKTNILYPDIIWYVKNNLTIGHNIKNNTISTYIIDPIKYDGLGGETEHITLNCPSINEFRKIIKLLTYNG